MSSQTKLKWRVFTIVVWLFVISVQLFQMGTTKEGASFLGVVTIVAASIVIVVTLITWREGSTDH